MTDRLTAELAQLRGMLAADGFGIEPVGRDGDVVDLQVTVVSPEACADCLVPKPLLRDLIGKQIEPFRLRLGELSYPAEFAGS